MFKRLRRKWKTIRHYNRMIKWAKKQDKDKDSDEYDMFKQIKENWYSSSCPYCTEYYSNCNNCELKGVEISANCCNGLWLDMDGSHSWEEWIKNAKKVRWYILIHG